MNNLLEKVKNIEHIENELRCCKYELEMELKQRFMLSMGVVNNVITLSDGSKFYYYFNINTNKYYFIQTNNSMIKYLATNISSKRISMNMH